MRLHLNSAAAAIAAVAAFAIAGAAPSSALTAQECSAKYNAAKAAGTLGETKWNDFRKAQCGEDAKPAEAAKPAEKAAEKPAAKAAPAAAASAAVFPKAIDAKYAK
ncbi:MAG: hypothetical protein ABL893_05680, partial [Hyphomicrobium sp.]